MTAVLKISVQDGAVLASDSRTTIIHNGGPTQVFDGVKKLFVLHKDVPIAMMAWGLNRVGGVPVAQLLQEVRDRFEGVAGEFADWKLDPSTADLREVAKKVANFLFHDHYLPASKTRPEKADISLHFAGFSHDGRNPEQVEYILSGEHIRGPEHAHTKAVQVNYNGTYTSRIMGSMDPRTIPVIVKAGVDEGTLRKAAGQLSSLSLRRLLAPAMPLQEVAALARCLMNSEIVFNRYGPEPDIVGGDIQMIVVDRTGCREMLFKTHGFEIPPGVWRNGNA